MTRSDDKQDPFAAFPKPILSAHDRSSHNRREVLASQRCACFCCGARFAAGKILEWTDEVNGQGQTAICPRCDVESVLGDASGFELTDAFVAEMHYYWFEQS